MANEISALRGELQSNDRVAEDDYQSFSAALGASARGRAFLHEYAKRNRHADTEVVLAALDRLETVARANKIAPEAERIRQDLRALLDTIRSARPQIDSTPGAIKAATLAALIEFVQARLEALVQPINAPIASVPEPEQPELPIPQPGTAAQRTIALVQAIVPPPVVEAPVAAKPVAPPAPVAPVPLVVPALIAEPAPTAVAPAPVAAAPQIIKSDERSSAFGVALFEPARSTKIIPEVNFIDSLFDEIDARKSMQAKPPELVAAATQPQPAPVEIPASVAAIFEQAATDHQPQALTESIDDFQPAGVTEAVALVTTTIEPQAETATEETLIVAVMPEMPPVTMTDAPVVAQTLVAEAMAGTPPAAPVVLDPSQQAMANAMAAIMALSDEERLAMFT